MTKKQGLLLAIRLLKGENMGVKHRSIEKLSDTLTLSIYPANSGDAYKAVYYKVIDGEKVPVSSEGFWIYDKTVKMNLAMRAETREAALLEVIHYYQKRCVNLLKERNELSSKIDTIKELLVDDDYYNEYRY